MGEKSINERSKISLYSVLNAFFPFIAIIVAIIISGFFVMWSKNYSIAKYFNAIQDLFVSIWQGSFQNQQVFFQMLEYVTPLIFTGVANAIAFRTGLFNIGAEGQFMMGMLAAALIGLLPGLSPFIHIPLIIIGGMLAGGGYASIVGFLKAKRGINEVITSIMLNYIALNFINLIIMRTPLTVRDATPQIMPSAMIPRFISISKANYSIFIGILVAFLIYYLLKHTTIGYELRSVGSNPSAAEYGGINVKRNMVLAIVLSGVIAGLGGATHVSGNLLKVSNLIGGFPGFGLDGMAVALLAKSNPLACILSACLFGALNASSRMMQLNGIPKQIVAIIQAIIILFVASDYIIKYFENRKRKKAILHE
ncbi:MAG: ABC transporter permease [Oscillospiraceae bacterium]|nr:ABC transporter permease [Oscillospiraceae bacterium]